MFTGENLGEILREMFARFIFNFTPTRENYYLRIRSQKLGCEVHEVVEMMFSWAGERHARGRNHGD